MSRSRTLVLLNPTAGSGRAGRIWEELCRSVPELASAERIAAASAELARSELREALASGDVDRLIAIGGDGTAHMAINGLLGVKGAAERTSFGLVPAGTGSDFARHLGLPKKPRAAVRRVLQSEPVPVDAIAVEREAAEGGGAATLYSLNIASAGLSGAVDEEVNASAEHGSYLLATIRGLLRFEPRPARVIADGEVVLDGPFFLAAMANGSHFGNGMKVAPDAVIDDGWLELVLVPPVPLWKMPWLLPQFLVGRHVRLPEVLVRRVREVRIEPSAGFHPYDLDGETLEASPATFRVLPGALRLLGRR